MNRFSHNAFVSYSGLAATGRMAHTCGTQSRTASGRRVREALSMHGQLNDLSGLLSRCASRDKSALQILFEQEGGRLIAIAARIVHRRDLAEEVVQDAFVQIWNKADQYDSTRGSARGWVHAIVRNRALNLIRDGKREENWDDNALATLSETQQMAQAESLVSALEHKSRLHECLSALDAKKRNSIVLAYVSGFTHGEIAGRMNIPLGTAKAWIRRGLTSLRECMS